VQQAKNIANEPLIKLKNMNEQNEGGQDHKNE
jgi:hypothetical protein